MSDTRPDHDDGPSQDPQDALDDDGPTLPLEQAVELHAAAAAEEALDQTVDVAPPGSASGADERTVFAPPPGDSAAAAPTLIEDGGSKPSSGEDLRTVARRPSARVSGSSALPSSSLDHSGDLKEGAVYAGKYELLHEIARGGMGVVYKARQIDLNRIVALKVMLSGGMAGEEERRRFILEAEASARLKHPNIVPVYDIGEVAGNLYFTMDYVEGDPLSKRKADLDQDALLQVMIQVADGVGFAHQRGIIHRDLKPANVMMDAANTPLIMDFGLAKQVDITDESGQPSLRTREGAVMGTPHYMPPEQADGRISEIDVRSDVWALGVILYELTTGELPFNARSLTELLFKIYEQDPKPPRQIDPSVDWDMEAIILKALEKDKAARYQTAYELKADLENVQQGLPVSARRATVVYRVRKWARRNRVALLVGALLALLSGVSAGLLYRQSQAAALEAQQAFEESLEDAHDAADELRRDGDQLAAALEELRSVEDLAERERRVRELTARVEDLAERLSGARGLLQPHLERPAARELDMGALADEEERQAEWSETLDTLRDVHVQLGKARLALEEARGLADAVEQEYARGGQAEVQVARWPTLRAALADLRDVDEASGEDGDAGESPSRQAFDARAGTARQHLFAAVSLSKEGWPEGARARQGVEAEARLRTRVEGAAERASRLRLAARMLQRGRRLLELLAAPREGLGDDALRTERLRAARLAQALIQRGKEAHTSEPLEAAGFDANRAYAEELLALKAYLVFDAELEAQDAFRPLDRRELLAAKRQAQRGTEALRAVLSGYGDKLEQALDQAALDAMLRSLAQLEDDPALDAELAVLRRDLLARARAKRDELVREEAQREIAAAVSAARSKASGGADPERLSDQVASWQAAQALSEKHRELLGATITDATLRTCRLAQAKLHHDAALALERQDPPRALDLAGRAAALYAPLAGDAEVDAQLGAARELVTRLQRVRAKPEGMVLVSGREDVELGSGPLDRNPVRRASLAPFYLAEKEVTCGEYAAFLASRQYADPAFWRGLGIDPQAAQRWPEGWTSASPPEGAGNLPVTGVSFEEARGYARFMGMRLPRDDEWEFAARYHGGARTAYPWGDGFAAGRLRNVLRPPGDNPADVTAEGLFDMGGNVSEWVTREGESGPEPAARGASFLYPTQRIAAATHRLLPRADYRGPQLGLRLAKDSQ